MNSMRGAFLKKKSTKRPARDVFANKSAIVLEWLLLRGISRPSFALREVAGENPVSLGLVHGVFEQLIDEGYLSVAGIRTAKTYAVKDPQRLLEAWRTHYNIVEKCRMWTYKSGLSGRDAVLSKLAHSKYWHNGALALHTAAAGLGFKHSNLESTELFLLDPSHRPTFEDLLRLEPQDRGYDVLLIQPYYKALLSNSYGSENQGARLLHPKVGGSLYCSSPLLTYLDLYRYPIRGEEQAEAIAERDPDIKRILK